MDLSWMPRGACNGTDPKVMHPEFGQGRPGNRIKVAKSICMRCPVIQPCLQYAIDNDIDTGVYGGLTPDERMEAMVL